jgi:hypothetical protein
MTPERRSEWEQEASAWGFTQQQIQALADDDLIESVLGVARSSTLRAAERAQIRWSAIADQARTTSRGCDDDGHGDSTHDRTEEADGVR